MIQNKHLIFFFLIIFVASASTILCDSDSYQIEQKFREPSYLSLTLTPGASIPLGDEREDFKFPGSKRKKLIEAIKKNHLKKVLGKNVTEINESDGTKYICEDGSWLLLRLSGTEPKLRIYSETSSRKRSLEYLKFGKKFAFRLM